MCERMKVPAVWKGDKELGIAYFCSQCHRFVCFSGRCDCGAEVDLNLPKEHYSGKATWENYAGGIEDECR